MNLPKHLATTSLLAIGLAAGIGSAQAEASADNNTAEFQVSIQILESCEINATGPTNIDFRTHTRSTNAPVDVDGAVTVNCSAGTPYQIGLDAGKNVDGTQRRMASGGNFVPYGLYQDASRTTEWGNDDGNMKGATGNASDQTHVMYGRVPSTDFPAGTYVDTVTARVVY